MGFNNLGWAGKYEPEWQFTTVNANGEWARNNPRVATGFVRALLRGQQFIWSNPDEAAAIAAGVLKTDVALARRSLAEAIRLGILDPKLDWSEIGLQRIYENMQADGTIPADRKFDLGAAHRRRISARRAGLDRNAEANKPAGTTAALLRLVYLAILDLRSRSVPFC